MACYQTLASPVAPPLDLLLRGAKREQVRHVMVHGQWVVRDGWSTLVDEGECMAELRADLVHLTAEDMAESAAAARALAPYLRHFYATDELVAAGIPPQSLVLGFRHPRVRSFTDFAVA